MVRAALCINCQQPIETARLRVEPLTHYCSRCASMGHTRSPWAQRELFSDGEFIDAAIVGGASATVRRVPSSYAVSTSQTNPYHLSKKKEKETKAKELLVNIVTDDDADSEPSVLTLPNNTLVNGCNNKGTDDGALPKEPEPVSFRQNYDGIDWRSQDNIIRVGDTIRFHAGSYASQFGKVTDVNHLTLTATIFGGGRTSLTCLKSWATKVTSARSRGKHAAKSCNPKKKTYFKLINDPMADRQSNRSGQTGLLIEDGKVWKAIKFDDGFVGKYANELLKDVTDAPVTLVVGDEIEITMGIWKGVSGKIIRLSDTMVDLEAPNGRTYNAPITFIANRCKKK